MFLTIPSSPVTLHSHIETMLEMRKEEDSKEHALESNRYGGWSQSLLLIVLKTCGSTEISRGNFTCTGNMAGNS